MRNILAGAFVLAVLVLLPASPAFAQEGRTGSVRGKVPDGSWRTLESEHFFVHFTEDSQQLAVQVADIAEDVHTRLSKDIKVELSDRTHIVVLDWYDSVNGLATPLPRNTIRLYPVGPGLSELELTFTDDWLRMIITHEYAHILTLDMADGVQSVLRKVFGRSVGTIPNIFMPVWIHEGYAVYNETKHTRGGRIRGPYFDMILRAAVLEKKFNTMSQAQAGVDSWPMATQYVYGAMFCQYLADRFGEERLLEIFRGQSCVLGPVVPWLPGQIEAVAISAYWLLLDPVGENGLRVFSRLPYKKLWAQWHAALKARYEKQRAEVEKKKLTFSRRRTNTGYRTVEPRFSPDGKRIAYISRGGDRRTQLRLMNCFGQDDRLLYHGGIESLSWSPDGKKIVFAMLDFWRGLYLYSDLYVYELESGAVRRLTRGLRARTPAWSPDGKKILFAVNSGSGNSDLAMLELKAQDRQVTYLTQTSDMSFYSGCAWAPDGKKIAFVQLVPGKLQQVCVANPDGSDAQVVTDGRAQALAPSWSPDGKYLLFTSSRTGIYNIFAYSFESKETVQLTNVLGGALSGSLSPDGGTLVFAGYSSDGWDIHTAPVKIKNAPKAQPFESLLADMKYERPVHTCTTRSYSAARTILPTAWTPFVYDTGEFGAMVAGTDILEKHFYTLHLGYNASLDRPVMGLLYDYEGCKYSGVPLTASVKAYRQPVFFEDLMEDIAGEYVDYWEDQSVLDVSLAASVWRSTETQVKLALGCEHKRFERVSHLEPGGTVPGTGKLGSVYLSGLFKNVKLYRKGISAADGREVGLSAKSALPSLGSDYRINSLTLSWSEYVSVGLADHHVVMVRVTGGASDGDIIDKRSFFQVGGPGQALPFSSAELIPLRGFKANKFLGTHAAVVTLEYRFPLWLIEGGPATRPVFFRKLSGYLFADSGNAWSGPMYLRKFKTGAGAGLRLTTDFFYQRLGGFALDVGFAHGFGRDGIDHIYFRVTFLW